MAVGGDDTEDLLQSGRCWELIHGEGRPLFHNTHPTFLLTTLPVTSFKRECPGAQSCTESRA
ncbi:hypothetical protein DPMN_073905 [Dreissena polymorpha]|uniref:Uncharacterized protein n=1 Tax=Dreissena polymorpha TaxID=45954 RepID=A0A9D4BK61_DREPO|nr:hypothetical protein DPMN_073905 [Dreissena polymorpha]